MAVSRNRRKSAGKAVAPRGRGACQLLEKLDDVIPVDRRNWLRAPIGGSGKPQRRDGVELKVTRMNAKPRGTHRRNGSPRSSKQPRTCIIVAGMHRSGTSAVARVVNLLGADITRRLMPAFPGDND